MNITVEDIQTLTQAVKAAIKEDLNAIYERFDAMDKRLDAVDKRIDDMEHRINQRFEIIDRRLENIEESLDTMVEDIAHNIIPIYVTRDEHQRLERRVDKIEQKIQN